LIFEEIYGILLISNKIYECEVIIIARFIGDSCPVCTKSFREGDDIVVCPDCGTPHHRACYSEIGRCARFQLHGVENRIEDKFERMVSEAESKQLHDEEDDWKAQDIFGVSKAELSAFMRIERDSHDYYTKIEHMKIININIFAWLFVPFYQFYKGMRLVGFAVLIPLFLQFLPYFYVHADRQEEFLARFGSSPEAFHSVASTIASFMMVLLVLFNDYVYLRYCAYKIKRIRFFIPDEHWSSSEYYDILRVKGAPSILRGVAETFAAIFLLMLAINLIV
jgi:hypothetical protein